ncbi:MAG: hypothetical protein RLY14_3525, partial [Planctomycetota bacterium]
FDGVQFLSEVGPLSHSLGQTLNLCAKTERHRFSSVVLIYGQTASSRLSHSVAFGLRCYVPRNEGAMHREMWHREL